MTFFLSAAWWWIVVPATAVTACSGIVRVMDSCRRRARLAVLWDDDLGPWSGSRAHCAGRTGRVGGQALTLASSRPTLHELIDEVRP